MIAVALLGIEPKISESNVRDSLRPCIPGLIIVQKYPIQNLDVDVIDRKLLIYFSLFQAFS